MATPSRLFMFRSGTSASLFGFVTEPQGQKLPAQFGPWTAIGVVRADQVPPHNLPRAAIETGIAANGYQLWRKKNVQAANQPAPAK